MFKKYYISLLIVALSVFGMVSQKQTTLPNQEIVVQFNEVSVETLEVESIVAAVKAKLQAFGVSQIKVFKTDNDTLKITYYSNTAVSSIENLLKAENLNLDFNEKSNERPSPQDDLAYNLDVYEIQKNNHTDWDFNGVNVSGLDYKSDSLFNPNTNILSFDYTFKTVNLLNNSSVKASKQIALAINNFPHKIPEVRAGPCDA